MMFRGVIATGDHVWAKIIDGTQNLSEHENSHSNNVNERVLQDMDAHVKSSHSKHPATQSRHSKKKGDATFLREQILQLITTCASMMSSASTIHACSST